MANATKTDVTARHRGTLKLATDEPSMDTSDLRYDYEQIEPMYRQQIMNAAVDIRRRQRRMTEDMIAIGQTLSVVRDLLPRGQLEEWVAVEFGYRRQWAYETINVAKRLANCPIIGQITDTSARLLAAPSVSDEAIEDVIQATESKGAPLTVEETKHIIDLHKAPPKMITVNATVSRPEPLAPRGSAEPPRGKLSAAAWDAELDAAMNDDGGTLADPTPPDLLAAGYQIELWKNTGRWVWSRATGLLDDRYYSLPFKTPGLAIEDARHDLWLNTPKSAPPPEPPAQDEISDEERAAIAEVQAFDEFEQWLAAAPRQPDLRQIASILEYAKRMAQRARELDHDLVYAVTDALIPWSRVINKIEKVVKHADPT